MMAKGLLGRIARVDRSTALLAVIIVLALLAGLALAVMRGPRDVDKAGDYDPKIYHHLALDLLDGKGYTSTYWAPAYPIFLAGIYLLAGPSPLVVYIVQAFLFAALMLLYHRIFLHLSESRPVAVLGTALCAFWPPFYKCTIPKLMTELLACVLLALAVHFLLHTIKRTTPGRALITGVLLGLTTIAKAVAFPFVFIAALLLLFAQGSKTTRFAAAVLLVLGAAAMVAPWTIKNTRESGGFTLVTTGGGFNLWLGNFPDRYENTYDSPPVPPALSQRVKGKTPAERDKIFTQEAIRIMKSNPTRTVRMFVRKFSSLWFGKLGTDPDLLRSWKIGFVAVGPLTVPYRSALYVLLFAAAVPGWFLMNKESRKRFMPVLVLLLCWTAVYVIMTDDPRYVLPVQFGESFLAAVSIHALFTRLGRRAQS